MGRFSSLLILISASFLSSGCNDNNYALSKQDLAAFKESPPEIQQLWEQGLKADRINDYLTAGNSYRALLTNNITANQLVAMQTALSGLNIRLNEAAAKGDTSATKILEAAKESSRRR